MVFILALRYLYLSAYTQIYAEQNVYIKSYVIKHIAHLTVTLFLHGKCYFVNHLLHFLMQVDFLLSLG